MTIDRDGLQAAGDESSKYESESDSSDASSNGGALHMKAVVDDDRTTVRATPVDGNESSEEECNNNLLTGGIKFTSMQDFKAFLYSESSVDESEDDSVKEEEFCCGMNLRQMLAGSVGART